LISGPLDEVMAETRQTYSGPLTIGEDLMSFEIGETGHGQVLQRQVITKARLSMLPSLK
jgi:hypothetical protein